MHLQVLTSFSTASAIQRVQGKMLGQSEKIGKKYFQEATADI